MRRLIVCVIVGVVILIAFNRCKQKGKQLLHQRTGVKVPECRARWMDGGIIIFPLPVLLITWNGEK